MSIKRSKDAVRASCPRYHLEREGAAVLPFAAAAGWRFGP